MTQPENGNGSSGRFLRMEEKLDALQADLNYFRIEAISRLVKLEQTVADRAASEARQVTQRSFKWMAAGILSSLLIGVASLIVKLV